MDVDELARLHTVVRGTDAGAASRAIDKLVAIGDRSPATFETLIAALIGDLAPDSPAPSAFWRIPHAVWQSAASALGRIGPPAYDYLDRRIADPGYAAREQLKIRAKEVPGFVEYRRAPAGDFDLDAVRHAARSDDAYTACRAVEKLATSGDTSPETVQLLIDLMASELSYQSDFSDPWGDVPEHHVWFEAGVALRTLGEAATDALIERIASPRTGDERLLERSAHVGRPLFPLARILVTDGDAKRARAAEPIVAEFVGELAVDEAVSIYLAVCDRERYAARPMPKLLREIWPRFATGEARAVIAERWEHRELRAWIAERVDRDPLAACMLLALLVAAPADATPLMIQLLQPLSDEGRWIAVESMLVVDPVRAGDVFASDPAIWSWAQARAQRRVGGPLELRLIIACGRSDDVLRSFIGSYEFTTQPERTIAVLRTLEIDRARLFRDQLIRARAGRQAEGLHAAVAAVIAAFPLDR